MKFGNKILIIIFFSASFLYSQEVDIIPALKLLESGNETEAVSNLQTLKRRFPSDPSVLFLDAVMTKNAPSAVSKLSSLIEKYPNSKYADAAVYRLYSYYYAIGLYNTARTQFQFLKDNYPNSPYLRINEFDIPLEDEILTETKKETPKQETKKTDTKTEELNIKYNFTVQAGAFINYENAENLKSEFQSSGYFSEIREKSVGGTLMFVVVVGRFTSENEARSFSQRINKEFKLDSRIINY